MKRLIAFALAVVIGLTARPALAVPMDTTIILDNFIDTNNTPLASHTISPTNTVSAAWSVPIGTVVIEAPAAHAVPTSNPYGWGLLDAGTGNYDGTITVTTSRSAAAEAGLVFRWTDANNWWALDWDSASGTLALIKIEAGSPTTVDSTTKTFSTSTDYVMQVIMNGSSLSATVDGGSTVSGSSGGFSDTATHHGFFGGFSGSSKYKDWTMTVTSGATSFVPAIINTPIRCCIFPRRLTQAP